MNNKQVVHHQQKIQLHPKKNNNVQKEFPSSTKNYKSSSQMAKQPKKEKKIKKEGDKKDKKVVTKTLPEQNPHLKEPLYQNETDLCVICHQTISETSKVRECGHLFWFVFYFLI